MKMNHDRLCLVKVEHINQNVHLLMTLISMQIAKLNVGCPTVYLTSSNKTASFNSQSPQERFSSGITVIWGVKISKSHLSR